MTSGSCTLVAVARNEAKHILEWLAYNLAVGFERVIVFENASTDSTSDLLSMAAGRDARITMVPWPSPDWVSPQCTAYNHALTLVTTPWVAFLDIDEFVVPWAQGSVPAFLAAVPEDVSAVHVNWRLFGSGGRTSEDYPLVTETFTTGAPLDWANHLHYKTFARRERIAEAFVHHVDVTAGRRVLSDMQDLQSDNPGIAHTVVYAGIQINHYQAKTLTEFQRRMKAGNAYFPEGHPEKSREENGLERFHILDRNDEEDTRIAPFVPGLKTQLAALTGQSDE